MEQPITTVANAPPQCDQPDCTRAAVYAYSWEWGEKGVCCETHRFTLNQTSEHLKRAVHFAPLQQNKAPITRDERTQLMAARLAAEAELEDVKTRGLDLYRENTNLTSQLQALTVRERETAAQLKDATATIQQLKDAAIRRDAELGQLSDEVSRLRTLAKFVDPVQQPAPKTSKTPTTPPAPKG